MEKKSNKGVVISLLIVIAVLIGSITYMFVSGTVIFNTDNNKDNENKTEEKEDNNIETGKEENEPTDEDIKAEESKVSRDEIVNELKVALTSDIWIKENLYSKKDCFENQVEVNEQKLWFSVLYDNENNPIVIVLNNTEESFIKVVYRVMYKEGQIVAESVQNYVSHPSHEEFKVDKSQGLVINIYGHMNYYKFKAYDVKTDKIEIYDEYSCYLCEYEYVGDKSYDLQDISLELNSTNINSYVK